MTNQEAFERSVRGMRAQGCKSVRRGDGFYCMYRGDQGRKCAIGHLIPDSEYRKGMENKGAGFVARKVPALALVDCDLLIDLQDVHDTYEPNEWDRQWKRIAKANKLKLPAGKVKVRDVSVEA